MKKLFFAIVLVLCSYSAFSQQQVILQRGNTMVKQFQDLTQSVVDMAQNDDIIYLGAGLYSGNVNITKRISIVGVGYYPNSSPISPGFTSIGGNIVFRNGSNGSILTGVRTAATINIGDEYVNNDTLCGILIERCYINSIKMAYYSSVSISHIIRNNVIKDLNGSNSGNVKNSIFSNNIISSIGGFYESNSFNNNIFTGKVWQDVNMCTFNNCIFFPGSNAIYMLSNNGQNNVFQYSIFVGFTPNINASSVSLAGYNNVNKDLLFENYTYSLNGNYPYFDFDYSHNYHLKTDCVGKNTGNDGTDIGIYGGLHVWKDGGLPGNPHVSVFNVSPAVPASGIINVNATVEGQNR